MITGRRTWAERAVTVAAVGVVTLVLQAGAAVAGPSGPASFGVMEPQGLSSSGCPWPDAANAFLQDVEGVQKCLPQAIPWSYEISEFGPQSGVRIVSDSLVAADPATEAAGQFTFWCQARVGLHYRLTVQGLAPSTSYAVTAVRLGPNTQISLGTLRTDPRGNGVTGGVLLLPNGSYGLLVFVGDALVPDPADPVIGFSVL